MHDDFQGLPSVGQRGAVDPMTLTRWFAAVAVLAVAYAVWAGHGQGAAVRTRDSAVAVSQAKDSVATGALWEMRRDSLTADSLGRQVDSLEGVAKRLTAIAYRPTPPVVRPDTTVRDSLRYWRDSAGVAQTTAETALAALHAHERVADGLRGQLAAEQAVAGHLRDALTAQTTRAEELEAALRKMPVGCRRILGLPIPRAGVGAALTTHGIEPALAIIVPIGGGC